MILQDGLLGGWGRTLLTTYSADSTLRSLEPRRSTGWGCDEAAEPCYEDRHFGVLSGISDGAALSEGNAAVSPGKVLRGGSAIAAQCDRLGQLDVRGARPLAQSRGAWVGSPLKA